MGAPLPTDYTEDLSLTWRNVTKSTARMFPSLITVPVYNTSLVTNACLIKWKFNTSQIVLGNLISVFRLQSCVSKSITFFVTCLFLYEGASFSALLNLLYHKKVYVKHLKSDSKVISKMILSLREICIKCDRFDKSHFIEKL